MSNYSSVYLREEDLTVVVRNGIDKPPVPKDIVKKWQDIIDLMSEILDVPASLVMQMTDSDMKVFLKSNGDKNPYPSDGKDSLGHGLYCETVIGRDQMLQVEDSLSNEKWKDNPDVELNMISYLGFPLHWPDGSIFGTICSLDSKPRNFNIQYQKLMRTFKNLIETDLQQELYMKVLEQENKVKDQMLREIHHRIKNNFNLILRSIQLKQSFNVSDFTSFFQDIENKIHAISLLHEKIYLSISLQPSTEEYLRELANQTIQNLSDGDIEFDFKISDLNLGKNLLNIGMILVELLTNSIKYAYPEECKIKPQFTLRLYAEKKNVFLAYSDNGFGEIDVNGKGFGSMLFKATAQQFGGEFKVMNKKNCVFIFDEALILAE